MGFKDERRCDFRHCKLHGLVHLIDVTILMGYSVFSLVTCSPTMKLNVLEQKQVLTKEKSSTPTHVRDWFETQTWLPLAVSLSWDTNIWLL